MGSEGAAGDRVLAMGAVPIRWLFFYAAGVMAMAGRTPLGPAERAFAGLEHARAYACVVNYGSFS